MTTLADYERLAFTLDPAHEAHEPPEARGLRRDGVRLMVSDGSLAPIDTHFTEIGEFLRAGDLLVVNTSATVPAALDARPKCNEKRAESSRNRQTGRLCCQGKRSFQFLRFVRGVECERQAFVVSKRRHGCLGSAATSDRAS